MPLGHDLLSTEEVRQKLGLKTKRAVREIAARYKEYLKPIKVGREWRFEQENVKNYIEKMRL